MKIFFSIISSIILLHGLHAQTISTKGNVLYIDQKPVFDVVKKGCQSIDGPCTIELSLKNGGVFCKAKSMTMSHEDKRKKGTKFVSLEFTHPRALTEIPFPNSIVLRPEDVVESLINAGVIVENQIDQEALVEFIEHNSGAITGTDEE